MCADRSDPCATAATVYGVVCPTGEVNLTDPDAQIAWHHAERANDDCPCGGRANSHVVRRMRDGRFGLVPEVPNHRRGRSA